MSEFIIFNSSDNVIITIHHSNPIFKNGIFKDLKSGNFPLHSQNLYCLAYNYFPENDLHWILDHLEKIAFLSYREHEKFCWRKIFELGRDDKNLYESEVYEKIKEQMFDHLTLHDIPFLYCGNSLYRGKSENNFISYDFDYIFSDFISYHLKNLTIEEYDAYIEHENASGEIMTAKDYIPLSLKLFKCQDSLDYCPQRNSGANPYYNVPEDEIWIKQNIHYKEFHNMFYYNQEIIKIKKDGENRFEITERARNDNLLSFQCIQKSMVIELMRVCNYNVTIHAFKKHNIDYKKYRKLTWCTDFPRKEKHWYRDFSKEYCISQMKLCLIYSVKHYADYLKSLSTLSDCSSINGIDSLEAKKCITLSYIINENHENSKLVYAPNLITFTDFIDFDDKNDIWYDDSYCYDILNNQILDSPDGDVIIGKIEKEKYKRAAEYYKNTGLKDFFLKHDVTQIPLNNWDW